MTVEERFARIRERAQAARDRKTQLEAKKEALQENVGEIVAELKEKHGVEDPRKLDEEIERREQELERIEKEAGSKLDDFEKSLQEFDRKATSND